MIYKMKGVCGGGKEGSGMRQAEGGGAEWRGSAEMADGSVENMEFNSQMILVDPR